MKGRILVIDDEESIRFTFLNFLSDEGYKVSTAENYDEAIRLLNDDEFDLVFADIILGGKTGIDLLQEISNRKLRCPVVMVTGYPNIDTASDAVRLGAFDYISKPVRQDTLLHTANLALQHKLLEDENEKYRSNLEAIFRSVQDAIITVDEDLRVLEVNEAAKAICGNDRDFVGQLFMDAKGDCNNKCLEALRKTLKLNKPIEIHRTECERKGRIKQVVTINTAPLIKRNGTFSGAVMVVRDETRLNDLERNLKERHQFSNIIGRSREIQKIYSLIEDLADVQSTVLITGESGTGKELVAEAIHYRGNRGNEPLVKVNCSALSEGLLESELFGHVKGAYTGADRDRVGRFQKADGGTIFLDEIGDISPKMQLRLLRVIQEREFERVGDSTPVKVNVRIITATNQDLSKKVKLGKFREDLYYRLKVVELALPPLRSRREDIPLLIEYFIKKFNHDFQKNIIAVSENVKKIFLEYQWPGNVRELEHTLEHAFVTVKQDVITVDHLPAEFQDFHDDKMVSGKHDILLEARQIQEALSKAGGNKSKAARLLGINVRTIYRKIEKYNIETE